MHGQDAAGDGAAPEARYAAVGEDGSGGEAVLAGRGAGGGDGVGDEADAVGAEHPKGEPDHLRVDVQAVGYEAAHDARVGEGRAGEARIPVVHRAHGVEEVGRAGHPAVEGAVGELEARVRMPRRDDRPAARGQIHELPGALQLRGERHHADRSEVEEVGEHPGFGGQDVRGGVGAALFQVHERAFEVDAEYLRAARGAAGRGAYPRQRVLVDGVGGGDHGRQISRDPGREQGPRKLPQPRRLRSHVHTKSPVDLQVHKARQDEGVGILADLLGFSRQRVVGPHVRHGAVAQQDRPPGPDLVVRHDPAPQRDEPHLSLLFTIAYLPSGGPTNQVVRVPGGVRGFRSSGVGKTRKPRHPSPPYGPRRTLPLCRGGFQTRPRPEIRRNGPIPAGAVRRAIMTRSRRFPTPGVSSGTDIGHAEEEEDA